MQNLEISKRMDIIVFLVISICISSLGLCCDEGANSFDWIREPAGWFALAIFTTTILSGQLIVSRILLKKYDNILKVIFSVIAGLILILSIFGIFV
tara:strand:+ start:376 stop:663 length:288 start_codon:yes stop_codon:yes gene_type:complete